MSQTTILNPRPAIGPKAIRLTALVLASLLLAVMVVAMWPTPTVLGETTPGQISEAATYVREAPASPVEANGGALTSVREAPSAPTGSITPTNVQGREGTGR